MFKPSKMTRIRIIINRSYFEHVISAIQDIGVMQIETLPEKVTSLLNPGEEVDSKRTSDYAQRFRGLESLLYKQHSEKMFSFNSIDDLMQKADSVKIDERVAAIRKELDEIDVSVKDVEGKLTLVNKLVGFNYDLSILNSENIISFVAYGRQLDLLEQEVRSMTKSRIIIKLDSYIIFSLKRVEIKQFSTVAEKYKVQLEVIPAELSGKVPEQKKELENSLTLLLSRKHSLEEELRSISHVHYPLVSALREQFDIEMEKIEIANKLGFSKSIIAMEGWTPSEDINKLEKTLREVTKNHFILEKVKSEDHPPTRLDNPVTLKLFELFVKFYSLPKNDEFDPTIVFAIAFPLFFGFMVGDAGYGALFLVVALWLLRRIKIRQKLDDTSGALGGFVKNIVSDNGLAILAKALLPGSIIAIILGIIFNEFFGFHAPYATPFDVTKGLPTLLNIAGWTGVFMVSFGFIIGFLNKIAVGEKKHAIGKLGWLAMAWGIVIFGLAVLHRSSLGLDNISAVVSYVLMVGGLATIFSVEGPNGLLELPSIVSHILSYTRLVGILLASVILAEVINMLFVSSLHSNSVLLILGGIVLLIVGQAFNIIVALFEPGIQGARLIYVEFFSKFFEGNGKAFKPFMNQRKHTLTRFKG